VAEQRLDDIQQEGHDFKIIYPAVGGTQELDGEN
jgi:hypothetical protein